MKLKLIIFTSIFIIFLLSCSSGKKRYEDIYFKSMDPSWKAINSKDSALKKNIAYNFFLQGVNNEIQDNLTSALFDYQLAYKYDSTASIAYAIGKTYKKFYRYLLSNDWLNEAVAKEPNFVEAIDLLAKNYYILGEYEMAAEFFNRAYEISPDISHRIRYAQSLANYDIDMAIKEYESLYDNNGSEEILKELIDLYRENEDKEKYLASLIELSKKYPYDSRNNLNIISLHLEEQNYSKALEFFEKMHSDMAYQENLEQVAITIGDYMIRDSLEITKEFGNRFLSITNKLDTETWQVNMIKAYIYADLDSTDIAFDLFDKVCEETIEEVPDICFRISIHYYLNENYELANYFINTLLEVEQAEWLYWYHSGLYLSQMKEDELAISSLYKALELNKNSIEVLSHLGLSYSNLSNYEKSDSAYVAALEIEPDSPLLNNNYAYSLAERNIKLGEALSRIKKAIAAEPNSVHYLDTYGYICYKLGDYEQALKYYLKAVDTNNPDKVVFEHLGDLYLELNKIEKAIESYKNALKIDSDYKNVINKLKKLEGS